MKCKLLVFILPILLLFPFGGCSSDVLITQDAKILIGGGPGTDFCFIKIYSNGTIEYISCDIKGENIGNDDFVGNIFKRETIKIPTKDLDSIKNLILSISKTEGNSKSSIDWEDINYVKALINGKVYISVYTVDVNDKGFSDSNINKDLLKLTYKLIGLAPFKVGGDSNPIKLPK